MAQFDLCHLINVRNHNTLIDAMSIKMEQFPSNNLFLHLIVWHPHWKQHVITNNVMVHCYLLLLVFRNRMLLQSSDSSGYWVGVWVCIY